MRDLHRRDAVKGIGTLAIAGLAGCTGDDSDGSGGETEEDTMGEETEEETMADETESSGDGDVFEYTFTDSDDAVESSLDGIRMDYPDGSGAVSDASVAAASLGGEDVTDDLDGTSTSNNGDSIIATFGGSYDIAAGDTLTAELTGVDRPDGSYTVETTVNPQSGATSFETSF